MPEPASSEPDEIFGMPEILILTEPSSTPPGRSPSTLLSSCNIYLAVPLKSLSVGLVPICSVLLFRAAIKVGTLLNSERLVMNIANDMRLRFENDLAALDRPLNFTVHNNALGNDTSDYLRLRRDNERSALQVALYLTIDLD
jgi:hypothetical protein